MAKKPMLTNNSDEALIADVFSGGHVFSIPYFQRAYTWKKDNVIRLHEDILRAVDEDDLHFLGAIIIHGNDSKPGKPKVFDVIDGQQRITTLFLYLAAILRTLCEQGEYQEAKYLFLEYMVIPRDIGLLSNFRLHPCKEDRNQWNAIFNEILSDAGFSKALGNAFTPKLLPATSDNHKRLLKKNYEVLRERLGEQLEQEGLDRIQDIYTALVSKLSVVQIDVADPTNGPKVYESLNSKQKPMTIGDLVRNEIFLRIASENPDVIEQVDEQCWQPFYNHLGIKWFEKYFFPYGLIHNQNVKKSEVYNSLRKKWEGIRDPKKIIESLSEYQNAFMDIVEGTNHQKHGKKIAGLFSNLTRLKAPSSVYPFLMRLSNGIRDKKIAAAEGSKILETVESFLVRRAVCGHEPTGLHAVFKRLWTDCKGKPTKDLVIKSIRQHRTVAWPSKVDFEKAIMSRPLYGTGIAKYLIVEYDRFLGGDLPANTIWVEHVLPESPVRGWLQIFTKEEHAEMKDLLANLLPLSVEMNISVSNKGYKAKRERYKKDSMFKSVREFAKQPDWNPNALAKRSRTLAKWACSRWST